MLLTGSFNEDVETTNADIISNWNPIEYEEWEEVLKRIKNKRATWSEEIASELSMQLKSLNWSFDNGYISTA
jgi:hypothetical protein